VLLVWQPAAAGVLDAWHHQMILAADTIFRPAYPDEVGRAKFVDGNRDWKLPSSEWFLALTSEPVERIVAVIRHHRSGRHSPEAAIDFRITAGAGGEIKERTEEFLTAFIAATASDFRGILRNTVTFSVDHPYERAMRNLGFVPKYRELQLETPWDEAAVKVSRAHSLFQRRFSRMNDAMTVPLRECAPEDAIPLLTELGLMPEQEIRALWHTPDSSQLDRDASACLILDGQTIGVVLCADAGDTIRIMAIAGREDVAGARSRAITGLLAHIVRVRGDCGYRWVRFRSNADTSLQTLHLALRNGGTVVRESRRWVKECL
jgi:hypothetical protein